jgi:hypothetical protein
MKKLTENETKQKIELYGWLFALYPLTFFIPMPIQVVNGITGAIFVLMCMENKEIKNIYHKSIGWGWALLPPVYIYKRCKALNENLLKFWLNIGLTAIYIILVISVMQ